MKKKPLEILRWIYDRMILIHKENPNVDYMIAFDKVIKGVESEMEIDKIATLHPEAGDTIVVSFDGRLTEQNIDYLKKQMKIAFPDNKCIVTHNTFSVSIALKWTSDLPTQEGWYWYRRTRNKHTACSIVHVTNAVKLYSNYPGEWYGPITPPENVQVESNRPTSERKNEVFDLQMGR